MLFLSRKKIQPTLIISSLGCAKSHLLVDVLDKLRHLLRLRLPVCRVAISLPAGGQSEVGLSVDVVEARLWHQQLSCPQLHVLQEGQTPLALPGPDPLAQVALAAPQACEHDVKKTKKKKTETSAHVTFSDILRVIRSHLWRFPDLPDDTECTVAAVML